jgi:hypothetical protein
MTASSTSHALARHCPQLTCTPTPVHFMLVLGCSRTVCNQPRTTPAAASTPVPAMGIILQASGVQAAQAAHCSMHPTGSAAMEAASTAKGQHRVQGSHSGVQEVDVAVICMPLLVLMMLRVAVCWSQIQAHRWAVRFSQCILALGKNPHKTCTGSA